MAFGGVMTVFCEIWAVMERRVKKSGYKNLMDRWAWSWASNSAVAGYTVTGYGQGATTNGRADSASSW
jgi:hypothetical protein